MAATFGGLLSGFEFEKQMYMTKDEIITRVEWMTTSSVELSQPVLVYNDGFKDGANFVLQNLQQTPCRAQFMKLILNQSEFEHDVERSQYNNNNNNTFAISRKAYCRKRFMCPKSSKSHYLPIGNQSVAQRVGYQYVVN